MRLLPALILGVPLAAQMSAPLQDRADRFLKLVNAGYQSLAYVAQQASWKAASDVKPASRAYAAFNGNPALITEARELLQHRKELKDITVRQLERVLLNAAEGPMTRPELVAARVAAETAQTSNLDGFVWKLEGRPISANEIDGLLAKSDNLAERRKVWEVSKENGPALKEGLVKLRDLRNGCAQALGYPDYFSLQVAKYGLSTDEMMAFNRKFLAELKPLYLQLHTWVKYEMAKKYGQPVPRAIPAHWINNRWSQNWTGFVKAVDFDPHFKGWQPERIVKTAEAFYTGLGFDPLSATTWTWSTTSAAS